MLQKHCVNIIISEDNQQNLLLDIVWTVYHLVIYMQSNRLHNVFLMSEFYSSRMFSSTCFGPHRSIIRSVLYKLYLQIWYVVIRVLLDTSSRYKVVGRTVFVFYVVFL